MCCIFSNEKKRLIRWKYKHTSQAIDRRDFVQNVSVWLEIFQLQHIPLQRAASFCTFYRSEGKHLEQFLPVSPLVIIETKKIFNLQICETGFKLLSSFKAHVNRHSKPKGCGL